MSLLHTRRSTNDIPLSPYFTEFPQTLLVWLSVIFSSYFITWILSESYWFVHHMSNRVALFTTGTQLPLPETSPFILTSHLLKNTGKSFLLINIHRKVLLTSFICDHSYDVPYWTNSFILEKQSLLAVLYMLNFRSGNLFKDNRYFNGTKL